MQDSSTLNNSDKTWEDLTECQPYLFVDGETKQYRIAITAGLTYIDEAGNELNKANMAFEAKKAGNIDALNKVFEEEMFRAMKSLLSYYNKVTSAEYSILFDEKVQLGLEQGFLNEDLLLLDALEAYGADRLDPTVYQEYFEIIDWHVPDHTNIDNIVVLVGFAKELMELIPRKSGDDHFCLDVVENNDVDLDLNDGEYSVTDNPEETNEVVSATAITYKTYRESIKGEKGKGIIRALKYYDNKIKESDSRVTFPGYSPPLDLAEEIKNLELWFATFDKFLKENEFEFPESVTISGGQRVSSMSNPDDEDWLEFGFDSSFNLVYVLFGGYQLQVGFDCRLAEEAFSNQRTNAFIHRFESINGDFPIREKVSWIEWVQKYVYPESIIVIDKDADEDSAIKEESDKPVKTVDDARKLDKNGKNPDLAQKQLTDKNKKSIKKEDPIFLNIREIAQKIQTIKQAYDFMFARVGIDKLIEEALKCISSDVDSLEDLILYTVIEEIFKKDFAKSKRDIENVLKYFPKDCLVSIFVDLFDGAVIQKEEGTVTEAPEPGPEPEVTAAPESEPTDSDIPDEVVKSFTGVIEGITFKVNSAKILKSSFEILDKAVATLGEYPQLRLLIEGHTSSDGGYNYNMRLSKRRADSVKRYLVDKGVAEDRLETKGFGPDDPIADNKTKEGRKQNRRIEFTILSEPLPEESCLPDEEVAEALAEAAPKLNADGKTILADGAGGAPPEEVTPEALAEEFKSTQELPTLIILREESINNAISNLTSGPCASYLKQNYDALMKEIAGNNPYLKKVISSTITFLSAGTFVDGRIQIPGVSGFQKFTIPDFPKFPVTQAGADISNNWSKVISDITTQIFSGLIKEIITIIQQQCSRNQGPGAKAVKDLTRPLSDIVEISSGVISDSVKDQLENLISDIGLDFEVVDPDETEEDISLEGFLDVVTSNLTAYELCSLLNGNASRALIKELMARIAAYFSAEKVEYFTKPQNVISFFKEINDIIEIDFCATVNSGDSNLNPVSDYLGNKNCLEDVVEDAKRKTLMNKGLSIEAAQEQIAKELQRNKEKFSKLSQVAFDKEGALAPTIGDPCEKAKAGIVSNPQFESGFDRVLATTFDGVETSFNQEINAYKSIVLNSTERVPSELANKNYQTLMSLPEDQRLSFISNEESFNMLFDPSVLESTGKQEQTDLQKEAWKLFGEPDEKGVYDFSDPPVNDLFAIANNTKNENYFKRLFPTVWSKLGDPSTVSSDQDSATFILPSLISSNKKVMKYSLGFANGIKDSYDVSIPNKGDFKRYLGEQEVSEEMILKLGQLGFSEDSFQLTSKPAQILVFNELMHRKVAKLFPDASSFQVTQFLSTLGNIYFDVAQAFFDLIFQEIYNSDLFKKGVYSDLSLSPSIDLFYDECFNEVIGEFDSLIGVKEIKDKVKKVFMDDFNPCDTRLNSGGPGPSKDAIKFGALFAYIRVFVVEKMVNSLFVFDVFDPKFAIEDLFYKSYIFNDFKAELASIGLLSDFYVTSKVLASKEEQESLDGEESLFYVFSKQFETVATNLIDILDHKDIDNYPDFILQGILSKLPLISPVKKFMDGVSYIDNITKKTLSDNKAALSEGTIFREEGFRVRFRVDESGNKVIYQDIFQDSIGWFANTPEVFLPGESGQNQFLEVAEISLSELVKAHQALTFLGFNLFDVFTEVKSFVRVKYATVMKSTDAVTSLLSTNDFKPTHGLNSLYIRPPQEGDLAGIDNIGLLTLWEGQSDLDISFIISLIGQVGTLSGEESQQYIASIFNEISANSADQAFKNSIDLSVFFEYLFPIKRYLSLSAVYVNEAVNNLYQFDNTFALTKKNIRTIWKVCTGVREGASLLDQEISQAAKIGRDTSNIDGVDFSALAQKFLLETPMLVLKGLAEITDPAVQVSSRIYDGVNAASKAAQQLAIDQQKEIINKIKSQAKEISSQQGIPEEQAIQQVLSEGELTLPDNLLPPRPTNVPETIKPLIALGLLPSAVPFGAGFPPPPVGPGVGPPLTPQGLAYLALLGTGLYDLIFKQSNNADVFPPPSSSPEEEKKKYNDNNCGLKDDTFSFITPGED